MVAEPVPVLQEVPMFDHELVNKLMAENEKLKSLVISLENKIVETEKRFEETSKISEERLRQNLEAESKIIQLKTAKQRLKEKLSDIEIEGHILQQQALTNSPTGQIPGHLAQTVQPVENGIHENVDALFRCIAENLGFSEGKPVAAFTIYKCLIHWKSFEAERTSVFDRLIQYVGSEIEDQANNDHMAYLLSNTSTLLFLLQQTLKATSSTPRKSPQPTSFFGRMAKVEASSSFWETFSYELFTYGDYLLQILSHLYLPFKFHVSYALARGTWEHREETLFDLLIDHSTAVHE